MVAVHDAVAALCMCGLVCDGNLSGASRPFTQGCLPLQSLGPSFRTRPVCLCARVHWLSQGRKATQHRTHLSM
jgi:hypothetical protein